MRGYLGHSMKNSWYGWAPRKNRMQEFEYINGNMCAREWPQGWIAIDGDEWIEHEGEPVNEPVIDDTPIVLTKREVSEFPRHWFLWRSEGVKVLMPFPLNRLSRSKTFTIQMRSLQTNHLEEVLQGGQQFQRLHSWERPGVISNVTSMWTHSLTGTRLKENRT